MEFIRSYYCIMALFLYSVLQSFSVVGLPPEVERGGQRVPSEDRRNVIIDSMVYLTGGPDNGFAAVVNSDLVSRDTFIRLAASERPPATLSRRSERVFNDIAARIARSTN